MWGNIAREEDELYEKEKLKVPEAEKEKANFGLSGALAKDEVHGNTYNGERSYFCSQFLCVVICGVVSCLLL